MPDQVPILKDIAKLAGKSVRSLNLFDYHVCKSPPDPARPWQWLPLPGDIFRHQLSLKCRGLKVRLCANAEFMVAQVSGAFAVGHFSINRRDLGDEEVAQRVPGFPKLPVFALHSSEILEPLLSSAPLRETLGTLQLNEKESLHLYTDAIVLYLQRASSQEIKDAIEIACRFVEQLPAAKKGIELGTLPSEFKRLERLIRKWGITDDEERSELIERASLRSLERLVEAVTPHLASIDEYLDSFGTDALSEAAIALGAVAECALEAQLQLDRRIPNR